MRKIFFIFLLCGIFCLLIFAVPDIAMTQERTVTSSSDQSTQSKGINSFWALTEKAQEFRWPLFLTFIIGMIIVVKKVVELAIDWMNARAIYNENFSRFKRKEQIESFARQYKCVVSDLIRLLLHSLKTSPNASQFTEEVEKFNEIRKQQFETFQNRMVFWSDTAGALGLLGTVWGMFQTFFRGDMDKQAILSGMGVALITTLMGLVISVILNFFATEVNGFFNKILIKFSQVSERLWLRILDIQPALVASVPQADISTKTVPRRSDFSSIPDKVEKKPVVQKKVNQEEEEHIEEEEVEYQLVGISGNAQKVFISQKSKQPFVVELQRVKNGLKQKVVGEAVTFFVANKIGIFDNGKGEVVKKTDGSGRAEVYFTPVKQNGDCQITVRHDSLPVDPVQFEVRVLAIKPADIRIRNGNNQSGPSGKTLPEPVVLEVVDEKENPIPNCVVQLKVVMGNGNFSNNKSSMEIATDDNGLVNVIFTLGSKGGFNAVQAEVADLADKRLSIQALGQ